MAKNEEPTRERRDWVNTISLEHVRRGVEGGFTQADHGKSTRLSRLQAGDPVKKGEAVVIWLVDKRTASEEQGQKDE